MGLTLPKLEASADLERLNGRYSGDYAIALRNTHGFSIQAESVADYLKISIFNALYGIRYGYFLEILMLLTAKANADAERVTKMEDESKNNKK